MNTAWHLCSHFVCNKAIDLESNVSSLPFLQCSSFCLQRILWGNESQPCEEEWEPQKVRKSKWMNERWFFMCFHLCGSFSQSFRFVVKEAGFLGEESVTHVDTSAMCLCLRLSHRSSSSSNRTSFVLVSPIPLVSKLKEDERARSVCVDSGVTKDAGGNIKCFFKADWQWI